MSAPKAISPLTAPSKVMFFDEVEEVVVPDIRLDDAPAAGEGPGEGRNGGHQPGSAKSFGKRTRL